MTEPVAYLDPEGAPDDDERLMLAVNWRACIKSERWIPLYSVRERFESVALRDYLAAHCPYPPHEYRDEDAKMRYQFADAMLRARKE